MNSHSFTLYSRAGPCLNGTLWSAYGLKHIRPYFFVMRGQKQLKQINRLAGLCFYFSLF